MLANVFDLQKWSRSISFADDVKPDSLSAPSGSHKRRAVSHPKAQSDEEDDKVSTVSMYNCWM